MRIRIAVYTTRPRGDVVHALSLAEALGDRGHDVEVWALGHRGAGFFRDARVPTVLVPTTHAQGDPVDVWLPAGADALVAAMRDRGGFDVNHAEDALTSRALLTLRAEGVVPWLIRTIHHVNAYSNPVLLEFQRASIVDADARVCVSRHWADRVEQEFGVASEVIANGLDGARFAECPLDRAAAGAQFGWGDRTTVLAVGGIEPRKGSRLLLEAFARARGRLGPGALLVIAGRGGTVPDIDEYLATWHRDAQRLGIRVAEGTGPVPPDADVVVLGVVPDERMPALYRASDALAFPSTREGFGLVVLEALASGIPAVVTDLPVLREHLEDGRDCVMVPPGDAGPLSNALVSAVRDAALRERLRTGGAATSARFTWQRAAEEHERLYERLLTGGVPVR